MRDKEIRIPNLDHLATAPDLKDLADWNSSKIQSDIYSDEEFITVDPDLLISMLKSRNIDFINPVSRYDKSHRARVVNVYINKKDTWKLEVFRDQP